MVKGIRALIVGLIGAIVLCGFGYFRDWQLTRQTMQAIERCEAEGARERQRSGLDIRLFCNVLEIDELREQRKPLVGVQQEISDLLEEARRRAPYLWYVVAVFFLMVFAIPYLWYFLLRRLREVRDALAGKEA
ncbi:hypothetical protein EJP67_09780 [Variovorax guangxiensis]|uniref:Uncharacterized protein n=1 Tax=Variovorax guangxiensis TaxID=1775474 RepID=A0A433MH39_9BURK|nr:hypothetical protein [Variovorax guangxiensis]RUR67349.1 hypothetical protein EJP67_09780 [Variovorax guangxiensis]